MQSSVLSYSRNGLSAVCAPSKHQLLVADHTEGLHSSQYGGYENVQWAGCIKTGEQCVLDRRDPTNETVLQTTCSQGSVSTYYVTCLARL